jgi:two-component sensor histidine kinase
VISFRNHRLNDGKNKIQLGVGLTCFILLTIVINCESPEISIHEEYYKKLKVILENKLKELQHNMTFVGKEVSHIKKNTVMQNINNLGLKMVNATVADQLGGSLNVENENGTKFIFKFNIET